MDIRPILSTLMRHKIASLLIVLEIALTCAIVCNALFLIGERLQRMRQPSGIAESELVTVSYTHLDVYKRQVLKSCLQKWFVPKCFLFRLYMFLSLCVESSLFANIKIM